MSPVDGWAREALAAIEARGHTRTVEPLESPQGPIVRIGGRSLINFSSNDYLSLAGDERLQQAAARALAHHGVGSGASRLIVGDSTAHHALEAGLANFLGTPAARLFNSGYAANVGLLSTLTQEGDVVFSDELNHASLIDGCRLSRARTVVYRHGDLRQLEALLEAHPAPRRLIVTDAVFSMDGDLAPLRQLDQLARHAGVGLVVDEAHAIGVLGPRGAGACAALHVEPDARMGTLGKALGSFGAWVGSSRAVADWLLNRSRSLVFSTSLPAAVCVASLAALQLAQADEARRARLWQVIRRFHAGLARLGVASTPDSAIASVIFGAPERALAASQFLRERGVLAKAIRPPTVPEGTSRVRFALCAGHTDEQVDLVLTALGELLKETPP